MFSPTDELKSVSLNEIQDTIAKALTDKLGAIIRCDIREMDFSRGVSVTAKITFSGETMEEMIASLEKHNDAVVG